MSKRVYEIARELDLSTREVLNLLNKAGMEVKSPSQVSSILSTRGVWQ